MGRNIPPQLVSAKSDFMERLVAIMLGVEDVAVLLGAQQLALRLGLRLGSDRRHAGPR